MLNKVFSKGYAGLRNWMLQRLTAAIMAVYSVVVGVLLISRQPTQFEQWQAIFSPLWMRVATLLFLFSLFAHAWLGVRDIFKDYVPNLKLRALLQCLVVIALFGYSAWSVNIVWSF